jgi:phage shock protein PspC (stress-responsive transcriptional regulator)
MSGYGKRLYRSNDRILGGVCGGIAEYFGIDPSLVRIAWVILTLAAGSGILLYLLAWLIIPSSPYATSSAPSGQASASASTSPSYSASYPTNSGLIVVAIIGAIILMAGLMSLAQRFFLFPFSAYILPLALVIVGIAVIAVAVMRRR